MDIKVLEQIEFEVLRNFEGATGNSERTTKVEFLISANSIHICEGCFTCLDFPEFSDSKSRMSYNSNLIDWEKIVRKRTDGKDLGTKVTLTLTHSGMRSKGSKTQELQLKLESDFLKDILSTSYLQGYGKAFLIVKFCNPQSHLESEKYLTAVRCRSFDQESNKMQISMLKGKGYCEGVMELPQPWQCWLEPAAQDTKRFYFADVIFKVDFRASESTAFSLSDIVDLNKLLNGQDETDFEIVAADMTHVKCHRVILTAQSEVLSRMLKASSRDARSSQIKMSDMSEEGIRALLRFLYYRDMGEAQKKTSVALELLKFSKEYAVIPLESAMKDILFSKSVDWYDVNATIKLFVYASKLDSCYNLKIKSTKVLYERSSEVVTSTVYNKLFREEPETVKVLVDALLSFKLLT